MSGDRRRSLRGPRRREVAASLAGRFHAGETSIPHLAESIGRPPSLVRRLLEEAGVVAPAWPCCLGLPEDGLAGVLAERYRLGASMDALSRETAIDRRAVRRLLERAGAALPEPSGPPALSTRELVESYRRGASLRELAALAGISYTRVRSVLLAAGVTLRSRGNTGTSQRP